MNIVILDNKIIMNIQPIKANDKEIMLIEMEGRLDSIQSEEFEEKIFHLIKEGYNYLLVNLSKITYLGSSGIRILLAASSKIKQNKGKLVITNMPSTGFKILQAMQLVESFEIYDDDKTALKKF